MNHLKTEDYFSRLLTTTWLRPERALFDAHLLNAVNKVLGDFEGPSLEYGCTDGTPTFVMLGGVIDPVYDDYLQVKLNGNQHSDKPGLNSDYFDIFENKKNISPIKDPANKKFSLGISWKESHIQKSNLFKIYNQLLMLPFEKDLTSVIESKFLTIFAPNLFWLDQQLLNSKMLQLKSLLSQNGRIVTIFPDIKQKNHILYYDCVKLNKDWARDLDRGIHENLTRHAFSYEDWDLKFASYGLKITDHQMFLPSSVSLIYQVGMRPMFPAFMKIYDKMKTISDQSFLEFKNNWIDLVSHFLKPFSKTDERKGFEQDNLWHVFELKVKNNDE
jgi:hypothetical protein